MELQDRSIRERFIREHNRNFSVIAPAGVGKTTAITQRIAAIIEQRSIPLEKLIVVTYTNKAAEELRERTWIEARKVGSDLNFCNKIFFGTIHAFADKLLREHGHLMAIAPDFEIEQNEAALWHSFLRNLEGESLIPSTIGRFISREEIYALVMNHYSETVTNFENSGISSPLYLDPLLEFPAKSNSNIIRFQENLRYWLQNQELLFPKLNTTAKEFVTLYGHILATAEDECSKICAFYFNGLVRKFEQFRLRTKRFTFHDLIKFSINLLNHEIAKNLLRNFFVILDEAQDTDGQQFELLLKIAQHQRFSDADIFQNSPLHGHFCMVGDPQQSIYSDRADVHFYLKTHKKLIENEALEELNLSVTMRFGQNIAQRVNQIFPNILDGKENQVPFFSITSGVEEFHHAPAPSGKNCNGWFRLNASASEDEPNFFGEFFSNKNPQNFGIHSWSEIAVLCPRKNWLYEIQEAFAKKNNAPKLQIHSATQTYGEFAEFSWIHALATVMLDPHNRFEFSGILREIFGISDPKIARHFRSNDVPEIITIEKLFETIRQKFMALSPLQIVDLLFQEFDLVARIVAIYGNFRREIQKELQLIALESFCGLDFLLRLQRKSQEIYQSDLIDTDAIQLYTFHKAKGLQWPIVIIPFINRKQTPAPHVFPDIIDKKIAINKRQYEEWADLDALTHNMERLLYVALTRQKQQTIFIDDGREAGPHSIAALLENSPQNKNFLRTLPFYEMI